MKLGIVFIGISDLRGIVNLHAPTAKDTDYVTIPGSDYGDAANAKLVLFPKLLEKQLADCNGADEHLPIPVIHHALIIKEKKDRYSETVYRLIDFTYDLGDTYPDYCECVKSFYGAHLKLAANYPGTVTITRLAYKDRAFISDPVYKGSLEVSR